MIGEYVLVRTYSAGVHIGTLKEMAGTEVVLLDSSRIWRWKGANTLDEVATKGVAKEYTRISKPSQLKKLTQAIEILLVSEDAKKTLYPRWS